jgi:excinuclease UvrABC ATPase subunit
VASGTPEEVAEVTESETGKFLRSMFNVEIPLASARGA